MRTGRGGAGTGSGPHRKQNVQNQDQISGEQDAIDPDEAAVARTPPEQADGLGLYLMTRGDLETAIGRCDPGSGADWEDSGATSREDAVRKTMLCRYRDDMDLTWRKHLVADVGTLTRLRALTTGAGNMSGVIEIIRRAAVISRHTGTPLRIPPLILVGKPGTGKTRIAGLIGSAIGTSVRIVAGSSLQDTGPLLGYGPAWRGAGPGIVAKSLIACLTAAPMVVIDEAEKTHFTTDSDEHPLDCILQLLEPTTASAFRDNYLDVKIRAENILWLFCVNSLDGLSRPLLDRCVVVDVPELSGDARHRALQELVVDTLLDHGVVPTDLDLESLEVLDGIGLRRTRTVVTAALAEALEAGRDWPKADDFRNAVKLLGGDTSRRVRQPAGFVHF